MIRAKTQLQLVARKEPEERTVQPELNLEQWPLFTPSQARGREYTVRTVEHIKTLPNGDTVTHTLDVGFCEYGTLTARDQRVLYALLAIWKEQGRPLGPYHYSIHRLEQLLNLKDGRATRKSLAASLQRLFSVTLTFKHCFFNAETGDIYHDQEPIHILSELNIRYREQLSDGTYEHNDSAGRVAFHPRVLTNLIKHYTRPVLFDVVLSFTNDTAQLLYALVDRQLAKKDSYTKVTTTLLQELGLSGKDYHKPSARKRALDKPVAELIGKPLSSGGYIASAVIEPTADLSDYKVSFTKQAATRASKAKGAAASKTQEATAATTQEAAVSQPPPVSRKPRAVVSKPAAPPAPLNEAEQSLFDRLTAHGISPRQARQLVTTRRAAAERELQAFAFRERASIKDAAAWLVAAIERGDYSAPPQLAAQRQEQRQQQQRPAQAPEQDNQQPAYEDYLRREMLALETRCPAALRVFAEEFTEVYALAKVELSEAERPAAELACFGQFVIRNPSLNIQSFTGWLRAQRPAAR